MKKDIFNGKLKSEYVGATLLSMLLAVVVFISLAIFFVCIAELYDNVGEDARIALYVFAGICLALALFFPTATILSVRSYPKHKRFTKLFVKEYALTDGQLRTTDEE